MLRRSAAHRSATRAHPAKTVPSPKDTTSRSCSLHRYPNKQPNAAALVSRRMLDKSRLSYRLAGEPVQCHYCRTNLWKEINGFLKLGSLLPLCTYSCDAPCFRLILFNAHSLTRTLGIKRNKCHQIDAGNQAEEHGPRDKRAIAQRIGLSATKFNHFNAKSINSHYYRVGSLRIPSQ